MIKANNKKLLFIALICLTVVVTIILSAVMISLHLKANVTDDPHNYFKLYAVNSDGEKIALNQVYRVKNNDIISFELDNDDFQYFISVDSEFGEVVNNVLHVTASEGEFRIYVSYIKKGYRTVEWYYLFSCDTL